MECHIVHFECAGLRVQLRAPSRLEDHVDAAALLRDADAPEPPYWAHVWTGSRALARFVAARVECAGRRIVDLGCGLGLAGIVAALRGGDVTLVDSVHDGLRIAARNLAANGCGAHVVQTDLRSPGLRGQFDYCLAADVTYDPALQTALADFLARYLTPGGRAWCAESVRTTDPGFHRACEAAGLVVRERELYEVDAGWEVLVRLTEVTRSRR